MTIATLAVKAAARRPVPLARLVRDWHAWIGALIAPSVLFFATTGVLQIWSLHEAHGGYTPPALIERLGALHKDQRLALKHRAPPQAARARAPVAPLTPRSGPSPPPSCSRPSSPQSPRAWSSRPWQGSGWPSAKAGSAARWGFSC